MEKTAFNQARMISANAANCPKDKSIDVLHVCEASACLEEATKTIEVKVGQLGSISLSLCNGCVSKFRDEQQ